MFLQTKDGIRCDICGSTYRQKFTYYSAECDTIHVHAAPQAVLPTKGTLSLDICDSCYADMLDRCKKHLGPLKKGHTKCDLCPAYMKGNFEYSRCVLAKVEVDADQKPEGPLSVENKFMDFNICGKCKSVIVNRMEDTKKAIKDGGDWS